MKINEITKPVVGDIIEFATDDFDVEGLIVAETEDGYVVEFSDQGYDSLFEASGYIPKNSQEAKDPRFMHALSVDVNTNTMSVMLSNFYPTQPVTDDGIPVTEAIYRGRKVPLNRPLRGDVKKFKVYVKNKAGKVVKVNFGHGGKSAKRAGQKTMRIKKSNPKNRKSFRARHNCKSPGPKTGARYWSCRMW